jgi:hypothetical protein
MYCELSIPNSIRRRLKEQQAVGMHDRIANSSVHGAAVGRNMTELQKWDEGKTEEEAVTAWC